MKHKVSNITKIFISFYIPIYLLLNAMDCFRSVTRFWSMTIGGNFWVVMVLTILTVCGLAIYLDTHFDDCHFGSGNVTIQEIWITFGAAVLLALMSIIIMGFPIMGAIMFVQMFI